MKKFFSIRKKVQLITVLIVLVAMIITSCVGLFGMINIQNETSKGGHELESSITQKSEQALLDQMQKNMKDIVEGKAQMAQSELQKFEGFTQTFASYAKNLYTNPEKYSKREVLSPLLENKDILSMQRYLANENINLSDVWDELCLLGNLEDVFSSFMEIYGESIATVYVGTESGFLVSYDNAAHRAFDNEHHSGEFYFSYYESEWYKQAKTSGKTFFTDTYLDSYGRGLTMTCVSPIFDDKNNFVGAVGIDILIDDLNKTIVNMDITPNSYAFIVNENGDIIVSQKINSNNAVLGNIIKDEELSAFRVCDEILSGKSGVVLSPDGIYFAYSPIPASSWTLVINTPGRDIVSPLYTMKDDISNIVDNVSIKIDNWIKFLILIFVVSSIIVILVLILISSKLSKKITSPIIRLSKDVEVVSNGDLSHITSVESNDEIGVLAMSFNKMTQSLQQHIDKLAVVKAEKERIAVELNVAQNIQSSMLPCIFPAFPERDEFDIYANMCPAKEVGGDFYDFFLIDDNHLALVIADVSGKGVPAALFMVITKTLIKNSAQSGLSPKEILQVVNNQLCENNDAGMFVTAWLGILEVSSGKMVCSNAGHEYPVIKRKNGEFELFKEKHGFVLAGMENVKYTEYEFTLEEEDMLFVYTDGVSEATNSANELFGIDRMLKSLNSNKKPSCKDIIVNMKSDIDAFVEEEPQFDDITMLAIQFNSTNKIELDVKAESIEKAIDFIEKGLTDKKIDKRIISSINIVIDEIYSNIVLYSKATYSQIRYKFINDGIEITFIDDGDEYNPLDTSDPDTTLSAEDRNIGGLGIYIVKKSMDSMSYERNNEKNILKVIKYIDKGSIT